MVGLMDKHHLTCDDIENYITLNSMDYDPNHQKTLHIAVDKLRQEIPDLIAIIAFGSFGTEYERNDSDIDLAILTDKIKSGMDTVTLWNLAQEIAARVGRDVELINLRETSTVFAFQALTTGSTLFCADSVKLAYFDNLIISMYLRLQEERKEILKSFKEEISHGG